MSYHKEFEQSRGRELMKWLAKDKSPYKINQVDMLADEDWAKKYMSPKKLEQYLELSEEEKRKQNGWLCGNKFDQYIQFNKADCEEVIQKGNSRIVLGRDRTSSKASGYGGKGGSHCAMIDLVVGTHGAYARETDSQGLPIHADPAFYNDAARIYITQKCDIDDAFGLRRGQTGRPRNKSAIALKADNIRIIAREGIKLVTKTDAINSQGGTVRALTGIELIAGNEDSDMQPLVKGDELVKYLANIVMSIQELNGVVNHFWTLVLRLETIAMFHTHVSPVGPTSPSMEMLAVVPANIAEDMAIQLPNQIITRVNTAMQEIEQWIERLATGKRFSLNPLATMKGTLLSKSNYTN